jgi:hypothetical protein
MDNGHGTRPDGTPAARAPWAGRRPEGESPPHMPPDPAGPGGGPSPGGSDAGDPRPGDGAAGGGDPGGPPPWGPEEEISFDERLRRAEEDLRREREAAAEGYGASTPPPGAGPPPPPGGGMDFAALFVLLDSLRRAVPGELQGRVTALIREALLTLRSLIDWYIDRLDRPEPEHTVEDIPID